MTRLFGRSQPQRPSTSLLANKTAPHQGSGNTGSGISETLPPLYRHLASFVPTRAVSLFGVAAIQLCALSLALVPCLGREFANYEFAPDGGEYSLSVDILKGGFGLQGQANLAGMLHVALRSGAAFFTIELETDVLAVFLSVPCPIVALACALFLSRPLLAAAVFALARAFSRGSLSPSLSPCLC